MSSRRGGFTLLEVLVATVVMGIAVAGLIAGLSQSVRNAGRLSEYDKGAMLARTKMNDLLLNRALPLSGSLEGKFGPDEAGSTDAGWKASIRPFEIQFPDQKQMPGMPLLQEVALEVWWQPAIGTRHTIQLAGYRRTHVPYPAAGSGL